MPSKNSRVVKLREETYQALAALIERQETRVADCGQTQWWQGEKLSFDTMIAKLVERFERDQARKAKSHAKRAAEKREALLSEVFTVKGCHGLTPAERFFGIRAQKD